MLRSSSSRVNTRVGSPARVTSRSYSFADTFTGCPATLTARARRSMVSAPIRVTGVTCGS